VHGGGPWSTLHGRRMHAGHLARSAFVCMGIKMIRGRATHHGWVFRTRLPLLQHMGVCHRCSRRTQEKMHRQPSQMHGQPSQMQVSVTSGTLSHL
jgi:hypothetical protein